MTQKSLIDSIYESVIKDEINKLNELHYTLHKDFEDSCYCDICRKIKYLDVINKMAQSKFDDPRFNLD